MRLLLARSGAILLVLNLFGCTAWQATQTPLSELKGRDVRITTKEGKPQEGELTNADSLGFAVLHRAFPKPNVLAVDTTTITVVENRVYSPTRTTAFVMTPLAIVVGVLVIWAKATGEGGD